MKQQLFCLVILLLLPTMAESGNAQKGRASAPLAMSLSIRKGLTGPEREKFWEDMKGKVMPRLRGAVVSAKPAVRAQVVTVAVSQSTTPEITITAPETPPRCHLEVGARVDFEGGESVEYTVCPFSLKLQGGKILSGCSQASPR